MEFMEREKIAEIMWKNFFQIQKYDMVSWKLKWNINPRWEINTTERHGWFPINFGDFLGTPPVAASLKFRIS